MSYEIEPEIRITDQTTLHLAEINSDIEDGKHVIVQFSDKLYDGKILSTINLLCKKYDKKFGVRFYSHYKTGFDCAVLQHLPDVKCLYIDCLSTAENITEIKNLKYLRRFSLGVFEFSETEILAYDNLKNLEDLLITPIKSGSINLEYLKEYKNLKYLWLGKHSKNIYTVGEISSLEKLQLTSINPVPLLFINNLKRLKELTFLLGGRENINEIKENEIERLSILRVRGLCGLNNISNFKKLKNLIIEDQIKLDELLFDKELPDLERLIIINCKNLSVLGNLQNLHGLKDLRIFRTAICFDDLLKVGLPASLENFRFVTGKKKIDDGIAIKITGLGYSQETKYC